MSIDAEMKAALVTFTIESLELLQDMEDGLLSLEDGEDPTERINSIFRAAHTIKGSSGLFGLDHIVKFTHVVESILDAVREGKLDVSSDLVAVLLPCCDHIALLIRAVVDGDVDENPDMTAAGDVLLAELRPFLDGNKAGPVATVASTQERVETSGGGEVETGNWHISLRFGEDSLRNGMDPLSFIRYMTTLGSIVNLTTITSRIPAVEEMDPETNYLGFEIDVKSDAGKEALENVFEFVRADSIIHILPLESAIADYIELIRSLPEDDVFLGELLVKSGVLTKRELEDGLSKQKIDSETSHQAQPIGEILVEQQVVQQPLVTAALEKQKQIKDNKARESQSIRVDAERLDKLIDLIGELVISSAGVNLRALQTAQSALLEATGEMMRLVEEVRDSALQLRMVPIGTTFSRFQRVVRDVSKELGKDINLVITGGETEVDKSVVEKIGDPLMHLVRNAMDHGIESAEVRHQKGKPSQGTLRLNAYHESGTIAIEVSDDGGGLNRERILAKAVEKGMVSADAKLSDQEVYALIFEPGFSTAAQISNLSGRGVGMDVVKRNVTDLRGSIEVDSAIGVGTTMRIRLPLTLAIIDGFLVGVGKSSFVVPLDRVVECVELTNDTGHNDYMDLRGEVLPFIRLRSLFGINEQPPRRANVVVVDVAGAKTGLVVDRLLGEFQTVIKPLGKLFAHVQGLGGSTILGSGEVALILDVPVLVGSFEQKMQRHALSLSA
ncbi:chemotaxis protein CheA [Methylomonas sp. EFPC3]|uniref:chemotaxis protein CheA n=1 Tax=Methylomonas sp. EFPC3 TaxID=3021710 RepID=UPI002417C031|nr:chemotaxis protein CheA [Methylomonas sp. EFPC3]WFP49104.1 chemotaxis protein CheA [Methylomonas sp. EFPC3]